LSAIGHFGGRFHALALERRPPHRDVVTLRVVDELERLTEAGALALGKRNLDGVAMEVDDLTPPGGTAHLDVLLDALHRLLVGNAVESFDDLRSRCAETAVDPTV
jgi:hypothetical protein